MITRSQASLEPKFDIEPKYWQKCLSQAISDPIELLKTLKLDSALSEKALEAAKLFPLRVTKHYLNQIRPNDIHDPLLRQVLPIEKECEIVAGYTHDPVGDATASIGSGILHKYQGRALLITTGACAIHCRYCFRRNYPYNDDNAIKHWPRMLETLKEMPTIDEVILSGGDPLSLSDERVHSLIKALAEIPHIKHLRIHTRLPLVIPERITSSLVNTLKNTRLKCAMVLHCNHPHELAAPLDSGLKALNQAGVTLLNQSVLLQGVNDNPETLIVLSKKLYDYGILPYYIHMLDPVEGAAHFVVCQEDAKQFEKILQSSLPGYLVPKFVREIAGNSAKTPIHRL